ncbi:hypothetical protein CKM354_000724500 [Cercospora kikuchii]|uniref:SprT-like domain-containing protein n=1 Tax=Cercospora kikuchii TaxID=84275 RepID=A0A9P3CJS8_9PEZI|nr:uncharacterized protein CKM354_000724500 [Cercospora kikuchii]GIZ44036.1 hypothetical protein CKM354_000724500 [Cercospora kikuchii]
MAPIKSSSRGNILTTSRTRNRKHEHGHVVRKPQQEILLGKAQEQRTVYQLKRYRHRIVELAMEAVKPLSKLSLQKYVGPGKTLFEWMCSLEIQFWFHKHRRQSERRIRRAWAEESGGLPFPQPMPNKALPSTEFMQEGIKLISDIFFFGALQHCSFTWKADLRAREGMLGQAQEPLNYSPNWQNIEIDPKDAHEHDETPDHVTSVIDTLLHECTHAFLSIYSCHNGIEETEAPRRRGKFNRKRHCRRQRIGKSCSDKKCQEQWARVSGPNGHGTAWLSIATHIGQIVQRDIWHRAELKWEYLMRNDFVETGVVIRKKDITKFSWNTRAKVEAFWHRATQVQEKIKAFEWWQKRRLGRREGEGREAREEVYQEFRRRAFEEEKATSVAEMELVIEE